MSFQTEINDAYSDIKSSGTAITLLFPDESGGYDHDNDVYIGDAEAKFFTYGLFLNVKDGSSGQVIKATKIIMIPAKGIPTRIDVSFKIKINSSGDIWNVVDSPGSIEVLEPSGDPIFYKILVSKG